ncbi:TKL protein kinase, variant 2 [Aphanomyces astaci]|uniref:TKL protein kinase, variant 2 n=1 Tax=Aphanomyces astaci TaxID=112090 RepID=W4GRN8_APHAT|nr:TKL protein kinase, variant 2 [Aphanomyces astaci]ETV81664.1 TKL protein kinase, variant 2 [Aphanomyces astaci]|eukprot:XP_009828401.1 TKL protein kinase, variant 2 [Aphanomyces astaci]
MKYTSALNRVSVSSCRPQDFVHGNQIAHIVVANCKPPTAMTMDLTELFELTHIDVHNCTLNEFPSWSTPSAVQSIKLVNIGLTTFPSIPPQLAPNTFIDLTQNPFALLTSSHCDTIRSRNISVDAAVTAQCLFSSSVLGLSPTSPPSPPEEAHTNPWNSVFTFIMILVVSALMGAFVMHRRRLLTPTSRTPGGTDDYLTSTTPIMETGSLPLSTDQLMMLSKAKDDISEPILTPFPPRAGRSYKLLPPKDVKLAARPPKAPIGQLSAHYHNTHVTLYRLDYRDYDQPRIDSFLHTVEVLATLKHPNITRLVGATKLSGVSICAVFDHSPTTDLGLPSFLFQTADSSILLPLHPKTHAALHRRMRTLAVGVADAIAFIHATTNGPMTRRLTSATVSVRPSDGSVRVNPMSWIDDDTTTDDKTNSNHPMVSFGSFVLASVAPECLTDSSSSTQSSDVFALGIVLGEIATCGRPFASWYKDMGAVAADARIHAVYTDASNDPIKPFPTVPPGPIADLIAACLDRDPSKRPTAAVVVASLHLACPVETNDEDEESSGTVAVEE